MTTPEARTFGMTRLFGAKTVVDALDLTIPRGAVYSLLGPDVAWLPGFAVLGLVVASLQFQKRLD